MDNQIEDLKNWSQNIINCFYDGDIHDGLRVKEYAESILKFLNDVKNAEILNKIQEIKELSEGVKKDSETECLDDAEEYLESYQDSLITI
mgnify:CR=1 FL=1